MRKIFSLFAAVLFAGSMFAAENETHDFAQSLSQLLNNNASIASINIAQQSYPVKEVIISYRYNKTLTNAVTMEVSVGGTSWGTANSVPTDKEYTTQSFTHEAVTGAIKIDFTNNTGSGTGHGTFYVDKVTLVEGASGGTPTCATPTFSPAAGAVLSGTTVALATITADADIYYTMGANPADPTSASTKYTAPISITEATTIKAIAVKEGYNNSGVASASYTVVTPLTTMQAIFDAATSTASPTYITFSNSWVVTGVSTNGKNVYITDGTKGMILFNNSGNMGLVVGNTLSGTVQRSLKLYSGAAELDGFTTDGLTIGTGSLPSVQELDEEGVAALSGVNTGSLIKISGACTEDNSKLYVAGVQLYNSLFAYTAPTAGNSYNVTGVYAQFNTTKEILPRSAADIEDITPAGAPEAPTFSPAAGTYTSVQTVELSCATDGATIYYTTDGSTPDDTKTEYTAAITVGESMTIKAIAIKDDISSAIASAAYVINIEDESVKKTWDLSIDETKTASADELTWTATYVDMSFTAGTSTAANNYYPGTSGKSYTSTRAYTGGTITITPVSSKQITTAVFTATSASYATALANATWTNATADADDKIVTVTASKSGAISATLGATAGFTAVTVNYKAASGTALDNAAVEGKAVKFIENGQLFIEKAGVRYNVMGQIIK